MFSLNQFNTNWLFIFCWHRLELVQNCFCRTLVWGPSTKTIKYGPWKVRILLPAPSQLLNALWH